ncbi:MAG: glycosyltransferase [Candidatus Brocadia sp. UTAMX2]|jgi:glycosyltransferase involved in cell wall biosynthesis|nr:MAG: glycosyltransferase [Candidatus Brocadia sp. UTAMX2]
MKIIIIRPEFKNPGGVSNYFSALNENFSVEIKHFDIGKRVEEKGFLRNFFRIFKDYFLFVKELRCREYDVVHINPSLDFKSVIRDGVFILLSKYYKIKIVVFFHGWLKTFEQKIIKLRTLWLFRKIYDNVDIFIVLATEFRNTLLKWGFKQPIYIETTAVDDGLVREFDIQTTIKKRMDIDTFRILFLARIIKEKGIYETIDAINMLHNKYPKLELVVAGDGEEIQHVKDYVKAKNVSNVVFTGYVKGKTKRKYLEESCVYCFPTYYREGIPISVLEAMVFGLPVITRPVGGIVDFFEQDKNGFITESKDPTDIANYIEKLYLNKDLYKKISFYNHRYASERFLASKVAKRLEKIYEEVL